MDDELEILRLHFRVDKDDLTIEPKKEGYIPNTVEWDAILELEESWKFTYEGTRFEYDGSRK